MADHLVWGGSLAITLPEGWRVTREDEQIEVVPPKGDGAVHFTLISLGPEVPQNEDMLRRVAGLFLMSQKTTPKETPIEVEHLQDGIRAKAALPTREFMDQKWHMDLRVSFSPGRALVGTYVWHVPDEHLRAEGISVVESIRSADSAPRTESRRPRLYRREHGPK